VRRVGGLWPQIACFSTLLVAARTAARGKRTTLGVARFLERAEWEALALERELLDGTWRPGPVARFTIHDPKPRTITVTPFRDQVVHHALMDTLAPALERRMLQDSYACRAGKGQHAALARAQRLVRRHAWFLKLDVRAFFASVQHAVALESLARVVKDRRALELVARILRGPEGEPDTGAGLPLGTLSSQWLANVVLDRLDHFVKEELGVPGYVRYMDDFVLFAGERARLCDAHLAVVDFLRARLALELKERATILAPADHGLPYLGWLVFGGTVRVRPENLRRYRWRLRLRRVEFERGRRSPESYRQGVTALFELLRHGNTRTLRRGWIARHALEL
jgi:hypothetical protein